MVAQWFYQNAKMQQSGPIDSKELRRLAEAGIVRPDTLIRPSESANWVRAERVQGLFNRTTPPPSSVSLVKATLVQPPARPPLQSALRESVAPSSDSPTRHGLSASAVNEASEKPYRIHPLTLVAIIASSGFVLLLLLLLAVAFQGGGAQQQAENDQPPSVVARSTEPNVSALTPQPLAQQDFETPAPLELDDRRGALDAKQHRADANEEFSASELYERASPSALLVENYDRNGKLAASGSGFLISPDGKAVTNLHVIRGAAAVTVRLSSGTTTAVRGVLCLDVAHDLAVLDIGGSGHDYLQLSEVKPAVGTRVYAIGNPKGLTGTFSEGVVSGLPVVDGVLYVQTTAAISPGSSGGPLLVANGTVIGITTASLRGGQNLNLAVPASVINSLLNEQQQPLTLAQVNARIGSENQQITTEDDAVKLAEIWDAIRANKTGDALRMLAAVPNSRRGTGYWIASGHVHFKLGNFDKSQTAFGEAVANDPNNTESLLRLALALCFDGSPAREGHNEIARDLCKRVIKLAPTSVPACVICGLCTKHDDWVESIGHFNMAVALDPADFSAQYNLGVEMLYRHQKDAWLPLQEALKLEKEINLDNYWVQHSVAMTLSDLTTLPTTSSLQVPLKLAIAKAYRDGQQYERAIQEYKEVLKIEPDNPVAPWGLHFSYSGWRGSDDSDARHWLRRGRGAYYTAGSSTETHMRDSLQLLRHASLVGTAVRSSALRSVGYDHEQRGLMSSSPTALCTSISSSARSLSRVDECRGGTSISTCAIRAPVSERRYQHSSLILLPS